jgi:N-acetylated-alpha-linked acidic dipeptidase
MQLADAELLPFEFGDLADTVEMYVKELKKLAEDTRNDIRERNREIEEGVFQATNDPRRPLVPPASEIEPPYLNFTPLESASEALSRSAKKYRKALDAANAGGGSALNSTPLAEINRMLMDTERKLTNAEGLPNRPWFKHQLYAPGFYTGYAVKTVPAVREAMELKKWQQADDAIVVVARILQEEAALISSAAAKLSTALGH